MKFRSAFAALSMTVALTACGELPFQQSDEPAVPAHTGPPTVSPLDAPIETGTEGAAISTAEATTMNTPIFRAAGAGWTVTAGDKLAVYERPGQRSTGITVRRITYARGVEFIGSMNGAVFALNISAAECQSGDQKTPFTAQLRVGSQHLTGCAAPTDSVPAPQTRASSAAPTPKTAPKPAAPAPKPAEKAPAAPATTETPAPAAPAAATAAPQTPVTPAPTAPAPTTPAPATPAAPAPAEAPAPATPAPSGTATEAAPAATPVPETVLPPPAATTE